MTQSPNRLTRSRSTTRQFLVRKTDLKAEDTGPPLSSITDLAVCLKELSETFPGMLSGNEFIDAAMPRLGSALKFCALAVRLEKAGSEENPTAGSETADIFIDVAQTIDSICDTENGIWGLLEGNIFSSLFFEKDAAAGLKLSNRIHARLSENRNDAAIIGVASYPKLNYTKGQILENARKALNHAVFFGPGSTVAFDAVSLNISGDQLYQEGDIVGAIAEFSAGLKIHPSNVNLHNSLGVCYGVWGEFGKAVEEFETAAWLDPAEFMPIYNLGLVNLLMGNREKALERFLEADETGEDVFEIAFQTGKLFLEMEKHEKGKAFLEKAVRMKPDSAIGFRYLGQCYTVLNATEKAVSAYKKAVKLNPNDAHSLSALGHLFELQSENAEIATLFCKKSIEISPENGLFRHRLGRLYLKQNRIEDALAQFIEATKLGHDSVALVEEAQNRLKDDQTIG